MRMNLPTLALAFAALGGAAPALSQSSAPAPLPMQFGQRVQLGPMMGERIVREVMVSQGGGGLTVIYDMAPGQPESKRVLRLENVNGMLEVIYDEAMPIRCRWAAAARRASSGRRRHVSVEYGPR